MIRFNPGKPTDTKHRKISSVEVHNGYSTDLSIKPVCLNNLLSEI
jgi:hypothetical protein